MKIQNNESIQPFYSLEKIKIKKMRAMKLTGVCGAWHITGGNRKCYHISGKQKSASEASVLQKQNFLRSRS